MDLLDCPTNVHKLDGVKAVSWALYSPDHVSSLGEQDIQLSLDVEENDVKDEIFLKLEKCTNNLRGSQHHVLLDPVRLSIWVFSLPEDDGPLINAMESQEPIFKATESFRVHKTADGVLEPPSIANAYGSLSTRPSAFDSKMRSIGGLKPVFQGPHDPLAIQNEPTSDEIFVKLIQALSMSFMRHLSKDSGWLPVGANRCIYIPALSTQDRQKRSSEFENEDMQDNTTPDLSVLSLKIQWHPMGTLIFSSWISVLPGFQLPHEHDGETGLYLQPVDEQVVLLPSGLIAVVLGYAVDVADELKNSILSRLAQQDLHISKRVTWLSLRLVGRIDHGVLVWPLRLCLRRTRVLKSIQAEAGMNKILTGDPLADPLVRAENWYTARFDRAAALATVRKDEEVALQQGSDTENEDMFLDYDSPSGDYAVIQDLTGIYPTPPDGPPAQPYSSSAMSQPETQPSAGYTAVIAANPASTSPLPASPGPERDRNSNEENGGGSLFGDVDIDLFASNGLTEADFNFFDEPSLDDIDIADNIQPSHSPQTMLFAIGAGTTETVADTAAQYAEQADNIADEPMEGAFLQATEIGNVESQLNSPFNTNHRELGNLSPVHSLRRSEVQATNIRDELSHLKRSPGRDSFGQIPFRSSLTEFDAKYAERGRFRTVRTEIPEGEKPSTLSLQRRYSIPRLNALRDLEDAKINEDISDQRNGPGLGSDISQSSSGSETESSSLLQNEDHIPVSEARKRKSEEMDLGRNPTTPAYSCSNTSFSQGDLTNFITCPPIELFIPQVSSHDEDVLSLDQEKFPRSYKPENLDSQAFLQIAQIVMDQIVMQNHECASTLRLQSVTRSLMSTYMARSIESKISRKFVQIWPGISRCSLKDLSIVGQKLTPQQEWSTNHLQTVAKRTSVSRQGKGVSDEPIRLFRIESPLVSVNRGDASIDVAIPALRFWEELSFGPISGTKDIAAMCILPASSFLHERATSFLSALGSMYQSLKLGKHKPYAVEDELDDGLVPIEMGLKDFDRVMGEVAEACERIGRMLAKSPSLKENFVIYLINAFDEPTAIPRLHEAFLRLFEAYASSMRGEKLQNANDIIVQMMPLNLVASSEGIVLPKPSLYKKLAFEVYDRCSPGPICDTPEITSFSCASAVRLAKAIPRQINLQLTSKPIDGSPLSDRCIHVGYCFTVGSPWLTASWIDSHGSLQWNAAYYLTTDTEDVWSHFSEVAQNMWDISLDLANTHGTPRRVFVVKSGHMDRKEYKVWISLSSQYETQVLLTILTIEADPWLRFPKGVSISALATPPLTTPTTTTFPPEQLGSSSNPSIATATANPSTPTFSSFETDADTRLVDVTEETWGLTISSAINALNVHADISCPLFTGFLIKRTGPFDQDGLLTCEVNLLYSQRPCEGLLKEVLGMYSSLATLARIRSIVDPVKSILPWHVAAAQKAYTALDLTMRWVED